MKIMAVSDRVVKGLHNSNLAERFPDIDLLIGCGDLPFYYLEFLHSALNTTLVYVRGNHDRGPQFTADGQILTAVRGGLDIHARVARVGELLVAGLEGSMRYRPQATLMYSEAEMRRQAVRLLPQLWLSRLRYGRAVDILVTHSPPWRIHDKDDLAHTGFRLFRWLMRLFRPRFLLHGHIHVYSNQVPRVSLFQHTTVINVYPYRVFQFEAPPAPQVVLA